MKKNESQYQKAIKTKELTKKYGLCCVGQQLLVMGLAPKCSVIRRQRRNKKGGRNGEENMMGGYKREDGEIQ